MIGTKLINGKFTEEEYAELAKWCNANDATIVETSDGFECVAVENAVENTVASWKDKIEAQIMFTALITDSLLE